MSERISPVFNGIYTIISDTNEHRTFRIRTCESAEKQRAKNPRRQPFAPGKRVIGVLTGPDNTKDYKQFGFVNDNGIAVWTKCRGTSGVKSLYEKYAAMIWDMLIKGEGSFFVHCGYKIEASCTCIKCNRVLTTPDSIANGIGPECQGRLNQRKANKFVPPSLPEQPQQKSELDRYLDGEIGGVPATLTDPPVGSWAATARIMASIPGDPNEPEMDWDEWKDRMKDEGSLLDPSDHELAAV